MNYKPLTKIITDENGNQMVACRYLGTDECREIHNSQNCSNCPMIAAWMNQLHIYEEILEDIDKNS